MREIQESRELQKSEQASLLLHRNNKLTIKEFCKTLGGVLILFVIIALIITAAKIIKI